MNGNLLDDIVAAAARLLTGKPPPRESFDPDMLIDLLLNRNLAPLASYQAGKLEGWRLRLEGEPLHKLDATLIQAKVRYMMVARALKDVLEIIGQYEPLLFKGLAAAELYPEPYLREPGDIDLLISSENFSSTVNKLVENGWEQQDTVHKDLPEHIASEFGFAVVLRHPESPVIVDLHRELVDRTEPFKLNTESVLLNGRKITLSEGSTIQCPSLVDHLIQISLHSVRHGFFCLRWSLDVHFACESWTDGIDREEFVARCQEFRLTRAVRTGIEVARAIFGPVRNPLDHIPFDRATRNAVIRRSPSVVVRGQFAHRKGWRRFSAMIDLMEGLTNKTEYLVKTTFPARALFVTEQSKIPGWGRYLSGRMRLLRQRAIIERER